jgi:hypothetical protein
VFTMGYELNFYISFRLILVFKWADVASRLPSNAEAWVRSLVSPCYIYCGRSCTGTGIGVLISPQPDQEGNKFQ